MRLLSAVLQTYESSPDFESEKEMTEFLFLGELFLLYIYIYTYRAGPKPWCRWSSTHRYESVQRIIKVRLVINYVRLKQDSWECNWVQFGRSVCGRRPAISRLTPAAAVYPVAVSLSEKPSAVGPSRSRVPVNHLKSYHCPRGFI